MTSSDQTMASPEVVGESILSCENITKSFLGVNALNGATFDVPKTAPRSFPIPSTA